MEKFGISQSVRRREDPRLLTGAGRYVDDIKPQDSLAGYVFRSPLAHARIKSIDIAEAESFPGVHLIITSKDLEASGVKNSISTTLVKNRDGNRAAKTTRPILATDKVRFVGEPVAFIVADTPEIAKDAAELIDVDFEELDAHLALAPGGEQLHPETPDNLAFDWADGDEEEVDKIFKSADHHIKLQIDHNRIICNSMEPRGCFAEIEDDRLHLCINGQGVWGPRRQIAFALGMDESELRVTNPDVGGGFGMKSFVYPENFLVAFVTKKLRRPVMWMSDRSEGMLSDNAGRDLTALAEMAFDKDHRILAYRVNSVCNLGAYNSGFAQNIQTTLSLYVLTGVYQIPKTFFGVKGIHTNTTQVDAYRGAGRPEAIYTLERIIDHAARTFNMDPLELRRKNFIPVDKFPYETPCGESYDVGDFHKVLNRAEMEADIKGFEARKAESDSRGMLRGIGLCYYIESILGAPEETTKIEFKEPGSVNLYVGTQSNGQGHETVFAQFLHDETGIPLDRINYIQGDSDLIDKGGGTGGSRSATTQGTSIKVTSRTAIDKYMPFVAEELGADSDQVEFDDGNFQVKGTNKYMSLLDAADVAREKDKQDLLVTECETKIPGRSYPNGAHIAEVEIDPETGLTKLVKYTVVDDFGRLMNPMLAEGQVHGGVAQGVGQAINESTVYDEFGQLLSGTFMDYSMPRASDLSMIEFHSEPVPSIRNEMGMKGCGEAGTVGSIAAVANAVQDALWSKGVKRVDMPFTPERIWKALSS